MDGAATRERARNPTRAISMSLLFERALGLRVQDADATPAILGVTADSRQVRPGWCFVAIRGVNQDGHAFIADAIHRGAAAVVIEDEAVAPSAPNVGIVRVPDAALALAKLAAAQSGLADVQAAGGLRLIGVTGTNGKSTCCYLMRSILRAAGHTPAMLGTIEYDLVSRSVPAPLTTPAPVELTSMLVEAHQAGADAAVMECSSHALKQKRTDGLTFDAAVFTNLTRDHLDYHGNFDDYLAAKKRLFDLLPAGGVAVVNADDARSGAIVASTRGRVLRFGFGSEDVSARIASLDDGGCTFTMRMPDGEIDVRLPLVGRHNVANAMAVAAAASGLGIAHGAIRDGLESVNAVPGRLESVSTPGATFSVLVDYAHTDDALRNALKAVRSFAGERRVTVIFGCGGNRDRTKRPLMARAAQELADRIVVTSDNPRNEEPEAIIEEILAGFVGAARDDVRVLTDRRAAIQAAIAEAAPDDVILIAGKGHETYQEIRGQRFDFDDRVIATAALRQRFGSGP